MSTKKKYASCSGLALMALLVCFSFFSCSFRDGEKPVPLPENFPALSDSAKIAFVMAVVSPDSVARFICDASLDRLPGITLESFPEAIRLAYMNLPDSSRVLFSETVNSYVAIQDIPSRTVLYIKGAGNKPGRLGYRLGLDYAERLRAGSISQEEILSELREIRSALHGKPLDFEKFLAGLNTGLDAGGFAGFSENLPALLTEK